MALSIDHLSEYLSQQNFRPSMELTWRQTEQSLPWKGDELPWNGLSCLSVVCYVLKFCSDSEHKDVIDTIKRLNHLASECSIAKVYIILQAEELESFSSAFSMMKRDPGNELTQPWKIPERRLPDSGERREIAETFVNTFMPKVQQFFILNPKRNENLAGFIHFLLQILNSESNDVRYERFVDSHYLQHLFTVPKRNGQLTYIFHKILNYVSHNTRYERLGSSILQNIQIGLHIWLQWSLNFILTVLGDVPFQSDANSLMREFEDVANEAAHLIYACFFSTCPVNACQFSEHAVVLSQKFNLLKVKIQERCVEISKLSIPVCANPKNTDAADSEFIMDSP